LFIDSKGISRNFDKSGPNLAFRSRIFNNFPKNECQPYER